MISEDEGCCAGGRARLLSNNEIKQCIKAASRAANRGGDGMKRMLMIAVAIVALASVMLAQTTDAQSSTTTTPSSMPQASTNTNAQASSTTAGTANASGNSAQGAIASGTAINAELSKGIDSKKAKENDPVQAKVVQDVVVGGKVVVPRNSKLIGHVTQVKAAGKGQESSLGIAFDKAVLRNGQEIPVHAVIQALAPAPRIPASAAYPSDDAGTSGGMGASQSGGYNSPSGGGGMGSGPVGAAASTVGGVAGAPAGAAGSVGTTATNTAGTAVGNTTNAAGMTTNGQLTAASRGVMGLPGVTLDAGAASSANGSVITNQKNNVRLDGGTQLVLRVTAQ
jgi:hypothetical protein